MQIIAHRCGTDRYPELTAKAALYSLAAGAAYAEADVRFTLDRVAVISHDPTAERLFGCTARIADLTAKEFCALPYKDGNGFFGTTLEALLASGATQLLLHIKEGGDENLRQIYDIFCASHAETDVLYGVVRAEDAAFLKAMDGNVRVLAFMPNVENAAEFATAGADVIRLWDAWATPASIADVHALGRQCYVMANGERLGYAAHERLFDLAAWGADGVLVNEAECVLQGK